jgi:hypothetical protein
VVYFLVALLLLITITLLVKMEAVVGFGIAYLTANNMVKAIYDKGEQSALEVSSYASKGPVKHGVRVPYPIRTSQAYRTPLHSAEAK